MRGVTWLRIAGVFVLLTVGGGVAWALQVAATVPVLLAICAVILGCTAARTRRPGEVLARLWWLLTLAAGLGAVAELCATLGRREVAWAGMLVSNLCWCAALLDLRGRLLRAELVPPPTRGWRIAAGLAVIVAAITAASALRDVVGGAAPEGAGAWLWLVRAVVGELCDAVVLAVGVQVLGRLRPLWGGAAAAPFLLITAAAGSFIVTDLGLLAAAPVWSRHLPIVVGWALLAVAGLAQLELDGAARRSAQQLRDALARWSA